MKKSELIEKKENLKREIEFRKTRIILLEGQIKRGKINGINEKYVNELQKTLDTFKEQEYALKGQIKEIDKELIK